MWMAGRAEKATEDVCLEERSRGWVGVARMRSGKISELGGEGLVRDSFRKIILAVSVEPSQLGVEEDRGCGAKGGRRGHPKAAKRQSLGADALACLTWRTAEPVTGRKRAVGS